MAYLVNQMNDGSVFVDISRLVDEDNKVTHFMCCICMDYTELDLSYFDETGRWDMCVDCGNREKTYADLIKAGKCPRDNAPIVEMNAPRTLNAKYWCSRCGWTGVSSG